MIRPTYLDIVSNDEEQSKPTWQARGRTTSTGGRPTNHSTLSGEETCGYIYIYIYVYIAVGWWTFVSVYELVFCTVLSSTVCIRPWASSGL